jgi:hypothetical protein
MRTLIGRLTVAVAAASIASLGISGCGNSPAASHPKVPLSSPRAAAPVPRAPSPSAAPTASAAPQLASFFAAAEVADAQLRRTSVLVNAGIGTQNVHLTAAAVAAVEALDAGRVARQIPAGMSPELLRRALLVYSDLESRQLAFRRVTEDRRQPTISVASFAGKDLLTCLGNGAPAAARFAGDLASARSLALATASFAVMPELSAAAAELSIRVAYINGLNGGCEECGGGIVTTQPPLVWNTRPGPGVSHGTGVFGSFAFEVDYLLGTGWVSTRGAC